MCFKRVKITYILLLEIKQAKARNINVLQYFSRKAELA